MKSMMPPRMFVSRKSPIHVDLELNEFRRQRG
jgi:hypothetical protein